MRNNKMFKKAMALGLALTIVAPTTALAERNGELELPNVVENGIIDIEVPTQLSFALDPMELTETGNQINSGNFEIYNRSNFPVHVDAYTTLNFKDNITLKSADNMMDAPTATTEKHMYFGIATAKTVTVKGINAANDIEKEDPAKKTAFVYETIVTNKTATDKTHIEVKPQGASVSLILDKAPYADGVFKFDATPANYSKAAKTVGAMKFVGLLNPNADWKAGDIVATMVYDVSGISDLTYKTEVDGIPGATPPVLKKVMDGTANTIKMVSGAAEELPDVTTAADVANRAITKKFTVTAATSAFGIQPTRVVEFSMTSAVGTDKKDYDIPWDATTYTSTFLEDAGVDTVTLQLGGPKVPDQATADTIYEQVKASGVHTARAVFDNGAVVEFEVTIPTP